MIYLPVLTGLPEIDRFLYREIRTVELESTFHLNCNLQPVCFYLFCALITIIKTNPGCIQITYTHIFKTIVFLLLKCSQYSCGVVVKKCGRYMQGNISKLFVEQYLRIYVTNLVQILLSLHVYKFSKCVQIYLLYCLLRVWCAENF